MHFISAHETFPIHRDKTGEEASGGSVVIVSIEPPVNLNPEVVKSYFFDERLDSDNVSNNLSSVNLLGSTHERTAIYVASPDVDVAETANLAMSVTSELLGYFGTRSIIEEFKPDDTPLS